MNKITVSGVVDEAIRTSDLKTSDPDLWEQYEKGTSSKRGFGTVYTFELDDENSMVLYGYLDGVRGAFGSMTAQERGESGTSLLKAVTKACQGWPNRETFPGVSVPGKEHGGDTPTKENDELADVVPIAKAASAKGSAAAKKAAAATSSPEAKAKAAEEKRVARETEKAEKAAARAAAKAERDAAKVEPVKHSIDRQNCTNDDLQLGIKILADAATSAKAALDKTLDGQELDVTNAEHLASAEYHAAVARVAKWLDNKVNSRVGRAEKRAAARA